MFIGGNNSFALFDYIMHNASLVADDRLNEMRCITNNYEGIGVLQRPPNGSIAFISDTQCTKTMLPMSIINTCADGRCLFRYFNVSFSAITLFAP